MRKPEKDHFHGMYVEGRESHMGFSPSTNPGSTDSHIVTEPSRDHPKNVSHENAFILDPKRGKQCLVWHQVSSIESGAGEMVQWLFGHADKILIK